MKWGILNLSPVARKVWWEKVKRVSFPTTPCSGRARYEECREPINFFFRFSLCVTCEQALPGVQGWGEEREEWERMLWRACSQATFCAIVLFEHAVIVTLDQSILLFFALVTLDQYSRLSLLIAFDGVVFAFNLMFHSDLWTAVALNSFHVSPLTLVAGTRCCVRNQNSTKQMQIIFCKILKKLKRFFYKVHMMFNSWGVITESKSYELYSCLGNFPRVFELF